MEEFEAVAAVRSQRISAGTFFPEERLPTERELAVEFKISHSSVRKTLAFIERKGLIARSVGRGTFLASSMPAAFEEYAIHERRPSE
jgi:DNA-binding GntR family transcriptional regulator